MNFLTVALVVVSLGGIAAQSLRWLRVAQREHYIAGSVTRFYRRWSRQGHWQLGPSTGRIPHFEFAALTVCAVGIALSPLSAVMASAVFAWTFPFGLGIRGRTSPLHWTRRLTTLALVVVVLNSALLSLCLLVYWPTACLVVFLAPWTVEAGLWLCEPYETRQAMRFVAAAEKKLQAVHPIIVGVTGSFGKTSTKNHLADLLGPNFGAVATPKSFNNRAGLSRSINELLGGDSRVFIAEMGTYGPGEIADLCSWCPPSIAVITAIGPVHLERMKHLHVIEKAKMEIAEQAHTVIVNVDDDLLAQWPMRISGKKFLTAGSRNAADVRVIRDAHTWRLLIEGREVAVVPAVSGIRETNLACAIAAARELGATMDDIVGRIASLRVVYNRSTVSVAPSGVTVIDDTFNANPQSSMSALETLVRLPVTGRRVVVTPGIVEMGSMQYPANEFFAHEVFTKGCELVIVQRTNASALRSGFGPSARFFATRPRAVEWVRHELTGRDAVLYLNDLPDHYP